MNKFPMSYDADTDRWIVSLDGEIYDLHCGDCFNLYVGDKPTPCRIEMDRDWYVIMKDVSFNLRKRSTYYVSL